MESEVKREVSSRAYREKGAPVKSGPESREYDRLRRSEAGCRAPLGGGDQHGCGGRISIARNVGIESFRRDLQGLRDSDDQVLIGLMHQESADGGRRVMRL